MAGEDATSSQLAEPALEPLRSGDLDEQRLHAIATRVRNFTWNTSMLSQWSWGEGVYLLAEIRYCERSGIQIPEKLLRWYQDRDEITLGHINNVAPGAGAVRLHHSGLIDAQRLDRTLQNWIAEGKGISYSSNGALEHWEGSVWADTCYMLGSYYLNKAVADGDRNLLDFVGRQLVAHIELLQNPKNKLFAHGSLQGMTLWNYWGRGNAWMALSCVEFLDACEELAVTHSEFPRILDALTNQLNSLINFLPDYGIWDVLVDRQIENRGILETSASAGLGAALIRAARHQRDNEDKWREVGRSVVSAALTYVDDAGVLTRTSAGTVLQLIPFGYSVIRSDRPQLWGQGLALNAITALLYPLANHLKL